MVPGRFALFTSSPWVVSPRVVSPSRWVVSPLNVSRFALLYIFLDIQLNYNLRYNTHILYTPYTWRWVVSPSNFFFQIFNENRMFHCVNVEWTNKMPDEEIYLVRFASLYYRTPSHLPNNSMQQSSGCMLNWYIYWTVKWELSSTRLESSSMITCDALCRYMNLVTTSSYKHCIHFLSCSFFTIWIFVMYTYLCIFTCPSLGPNWSINILNLESW